MTVSKSIVFDTWPIMAYLQGEPPTERIIEIIANANESRDSLLMSVVNAGEVWYSIAKRSDATNADRAIAMIRSLGIEFIEVDWPTTQIAARYKALGGISYADCFAAALARKTATDRASCVLITGDREFEQLENEIDIVWL